MKTKTKLTLGVGLLFILIILLSLVGAFYINALKSDTENILKANYNSLIYSRNILTVLDNPNEKEIELIEQNLKNQEGNNTEIGESEANVELRNNIEIYKKESTNSDTRHVIQQNLYHIMDMNMQAIQRKSEIAKSTADNAVFWIAITGTLCFLIAFILLVNLPSNIANPIKELTESIKQIAYRNYAERVHFESHSEFGQLAKSFNTMAEKLQEYNSSNLAKLMMEKKRIETLINNMHDPVIGLDENLKVIFVNEEAIKVTGMSKESLMGHFTQELAVKNDLIRTLIQDLMIGPSEKRSNPIKIFSNDKEGYFEKETLQISVTPTGEQSEQLIGHVIILRNITEYKELDFAKTNFIGTISHELKTPISSILMSTKLLEDERVGAINNEQKLLIHDIEEESNRLLRITGELINMAQVETGKIELTLSPSNPEEIVEYALRATKTQAIEKKIAFEVNIDESMPLVSANTEKTAWVLTNLILNAIHYSYENSKITISVTYKENSFVRFSVRDFGKGIDSKYHQKVFSRYFRVPGSEENGSGLGLAICKEFIEAQGGNIHVESDMGVGSNFYFELKTV